jgi:hypothetical protein
MKDLKIARVPGKIRTGNFPNTNCNRYYSGKFARYDNSQVHIHVACNLQITSLFHTEKVPIKCINTVHAAQCNTTKTSHNKNCSV